MVLFLFPDSFLILLFSLHFDHCDIGFSNEGADYDDENGDFEGPRGYRGRGRGRGRRGSFGPGRGYAGDGYVNEEAGGYHGGEYNAPPAQGYGSFCLNFTYLKALINLFILTPIYFFPFLAHCSFNSLFVITELSTTSSACVTANDFLESSDVLNC